MSIELEATFDSVLRNQIPDLWFKVKTTWFRICQEPFLIWALWFPHRRAIPRWWVFAVTSRICVNESNSSKIGSATNWVERTRRRLQRPHSGRVIIKTQNLVTNSIKSGHKFYQIWSHYRAKYEAACIAAEEEGRDQPSEPVIKVEWNLLERKM